MSGKAPPQGKAVLCQALIPLLIRPNVGVMKHVVSIALVLTLAGCAGGMPDLRNGGLLKGLKRDRGNDPVQTAPTTGSVPTPMQETIALPPEDAVTVEDFDTTTSAQRDAALVDAPAANDGRIGTTVASLGDPGETGFWIKTPLVSEQTSGRVVYVRSGRSVQVQLIPSGGANGSGSQVSLAAMRLLDAPLTELPELVVYKN